MPNPITGQDYINAQNGGYDPFVSLLAWRWDEMPDTIEQLDADDYLTLMDDLTMPLPHIKWSGRSITIPGLIRGLDDTEAGTIAEVTLSSGKSVMLRMPKGVDFINYMSKDENNILDYLRIAGLPWTEKEFGQLDIKDVWGIIQVLSVFKLAPRRSISDIFPGS